MWVGSVTLEYVIYIMWAPNKVRILFNIHTFKLTRENLGRVILLALFTRIIAHPYTIHKNYYSLLYYSQETLFISELFTKNIIHKSTIVEIPTLFAIFLLLIMALFIFRTSVNFFLFSKFLPMKVRQWMTMSKAKKGWNITMQVNNATWLTHQRQDAPPNHKWLLPTF